MNELAEALASLLQGVERAWERGTFRFAFDGDRETLAGVVFAGGALAAVEGDALAPAAAELSRLAREVLRSFEHEEGLLLVVLEPDGYHDMRFEFDQLDRWPLSSIDPASGVPGDLEV